MQKNVIFFDLGNTLLFNNRRNSIESAVKALAEAAVAAGYPYDPLVFAKNHTEVLLNSYRQRDINGIEKTPEETIERTIRQFAMPPICQEQREKAILAFYGLTEKNWQIIENAELVLSQLKAQGRRLGLITNASCERDVLNLIEKRNLESYFEHLVISANVGFRKPRKEIFEKAMSLFGTTSDRCVMIGNTYCADIRGASLAGMHSIWYTRYPEDHVDSSFQTKDLQNAETQDLLDIPIILEQFDLE